jgi:torulene dioxygenase
VELKIDGTIPTYAAGTLFRTGLGVRDIETENGKLFRVNHWFDNLAQVHRFQIHAPEAGCTQVRRITYNSRSVCDGLIANLKATGNREGVTFGAKYDPCTALFQKAQSQFTPTTPPLTPPPMPMKAPPGGFTPRQRPKKADELSVAVALTVNHAGLTAKGEGNGEARGRQKMIESLCNRTDTDAIQFLDPETLEPIGVASQGTLHPSLKGPSSATHSSMDPRTGDVFNYNLEFCKGQGIYRIFSVSAATGKTSILATITDQPAYIHSLFLTEHYVVLCVWNAVYAHGGAAVLWTKNIVDALAAYDPERPCKWYVIDRISEDDGGRGLVATYESDPFFCFHTVNAYEEESEAGEVSIVADLVAYRDLDILKRLYIDNLLSNSESAARFVGYENCHPNMRRFVLEGIPGAPTDPFVLSGQSLGGAEVGDGDEDGVMEVCYGFVAEQQVSPELPTINSRYGTKKHRLVYGVLHTGKSTLFDCIVKHDLLDGSAMTWFVHGHTPGEPIFVADPSWDAEMDEASEEAEDKGVLLSIVLDGIKGKSYLLVLDATTMRELGRAHVDGVVGFGFHGTHVSEA